ncbi:MAG: hypothetical protein WD876_03195 [Candidatus Pacearchaeota archaeon]
MIIGLTGRIASGKAEAAKYFIDKGFEYYTISQMVREVVSKIEIPIMRESLQDVGNLIRKYEGSGGWIKRIIKRLDFKKNYVIDGIRNPGEIEELKKFKDFYLVSVDVPVDIRFERVLRRNKLSDPKTWELFVKADERDFGVNEINTGQQVGKCMAVADFKIVNDGTLNDLRVKIEQIYKNIMGEKLE